nr:hypothetical protein Q903MT_gene2865 [Picea sitchensis]
MDFSRGRDITTIDRVSNNIDRRLSFIPIHFSLHLYLLYECGLNAKSNILIILCLLLSIISPFLLNVFFPGLNTYGYIKKLLLHHQKPQNDRNQAKI